MAARIDVTPDDLKTWHGDAAHPALPADRLEFFTRHIRPRLSREGHQPWSFDRHEYLVAPLLDLAARQCYEKAAQGGFSTVALGTTIHVAGALGLHAGYHLTTDDYVSTFVQSRFDPLIDADETLANLVTQGDPAIYLSEAARRRHKRADHTQLKLLGRGQVLFQGVQNMADVKSADLDLVVLDEVDELNPELAAYLDDRILHSDYKRRLALSQPSVPDFGIDAEYSASDQKRFLLRCTRGHWINLEECFPACVSPLPGGKGAGGKRLPAFICPHCGARFPYLDHHNSVRWPRRVSEAPKIVDEHGRACAEWVAAYPDRPISGYRFSQLYGPQTAAPDLYADWLASRGNATKLGRYTRSVLGLPFAADRQPISPAAFDRACNAAVTATRPPDPGLLRLASSCWAGIDVGDVLHLVIGIDLPGGYTQVIWLEEVSGWTELDLRLRDFGVRSWIIDARPEKASAKTLLHAWPNQGALCYWSDTVDQVTHGDEEDGLLYIRYLRVPRTESLDEMCACVLRPEAANGAVRFPSAVSPSVDIAKRHFAKLVKEKGTTAGRQRYLDGVENHFACACCYMLLARKWAPVIGLGPAVDLTTGEWSVPRQEVRHQW